LVNEIYSDVYSRSYGYKATGLRYFNVFGPRQDPQGAYAAVIPLWVTAMARGHQVTIKGDGETSRDFCYIANAVQANIKAALAPDRVQGGVFNVAVGQRTTLAELFTMLRATLAQSGVNYAREPMFSDFSPGDVRHSLADIRKAQTLIGYEPTHSIGEGLAEAVPWYLERVNKGMFD
jgi:UDP-N-acetylglucosamine 4-epimerase